MTVSFFLFMSSVKDKEKWSNSVALYSLFLNQSQRIFSFVPSKNEQSPNGAAATQWRPWKAPGTKGLPLTSVFRMSPSNNRNVQLQCVPGTQDLLLSAVTRTETTCPPLSSPHSQHNALTAPWTPAKAWKLSLGAVEESR